MKKLVIFLSTLLVSISASASYTTQQAQMQLLKNRSVYFSYIDNCSVSNDVDVNLLGQPLLFFTADLNMRIQSSLETITARIKWVKKGQVADQTRINKERAKIVENSSLLAAMTVADKNSLDSVDLGALEYHPNGFDKMQCTSLQHTFSSMTKFIRNNL